MRNCLSNNFIDDLNHNFNPQTIISKYGTHVYKNIKVGGKIVVLYRANLSSTSSATEKKNTVTAGLSGSIGKIFGGSIETSISKEEIEKVSKRISYAQFVINAIGGNSSIPMMGVTINAQNNDYSINIQEWERSVTDGATTLIDFNPGTLIPIWEFVSDTNKRNSLQTAIEKYIINKALTDKVMMYEYVCSNGNFFCTISVEELESYGYSRVGSYGYVYPYQYSGTVALHVYKSLYNNDHTYTYQRNDSHYENHGYRYFHVECYVPSPNLNTTSEIMPVYFYSRIIDGHLNHYYSINKMSHYQGAPYGGIAFYVYKYNKYNRFQISYKNSF